MPKPTLGPVAVGDQLLVISAPSKWHPKQPTEVVVVKKGRIWIDLREVNQVASMARTWRMRLDTQNDGNTIGAGGDRFVTAEQQAWEQRIGDARAVLRDAKVSPDSASLWNRDEGRLLALADFIRAYDTEHPAA